MARYRQTEQQKRGKQLEKTWVVKSAGSSVDKKAKPAKMK